MLKPFSVYHTDRNKTLTVTLEAHSDRGGEPNTLLTVRSAVRGALFGGLLSQAQLLLLFAHEMKIYRKEGPLRHTWRSAETL